MIENRWDRPSGKAVYVQVPFCPERCDYCAIPVTVSEGLLPDYLDALEYEVKRVRNAFRDESPVSVYIGGGSPTSIPQGSLDRLIALLAPFLEGAKEVTFESRPEALSDGILERLSRIGPGLRLSLGMEAIDGASLQALGRHSPVQDPITRLASLRQKTQASISMDFIITGDEFDLESFLGICRDLKASGLDHLSIYPLVIEEKTVLSLRKSQGKTKEDLEERAAENWRRCCDGLCAEGWVRYEVSNFARSDRDGCRHNIHVWRGGEFLGLGPGAHQTCGNVRSENVRSLLEYVRLSRGENRHPFAAREILSDKEVYYERLYTNLRLNTGLPLRWLRTGSDQESVRTILDEIVRNGYGTVDRTNEEVLVLSGEGLHLLDSIAERLLSASEDP